MTANLLRQLAGPHQRLLAQIRALDDGTAGAMEAATPVGPSPVLSGRVAIDAAEAIDRSRWECFRKGATPPCRIL